MFSPIFSSLTAYLLTSFLLTLTPGPDALLVMRTSITGGRRKGLGVVCGIASAWLLWGLAAMGGLSALVVVSKTGFQLLKWIGVLYLVWLALRMLFNSAQTAPMLNLESEALIGAGSPGPEPASGFWASWRQGLLATLTNPFVGLMVCAFFPQFIPPGSNVAAFTLLLTLLQMAVALVVFGSLVLLTVPLGRFLTRPSVARAFDWVTGLLLLAFSVKLALATVPR
ncbi:LysE family translocator [Oecophyllibacter saccharovorans]|uniref:LysE family translocator n=1 Tax=Oecophyllibacter saccharovorans TaxID=2558360 RepID=UPI0018840DF7|nr:LysE family translocator [Oecophyllibacter saccharovorans]